MVELILLASAILGAIVLLIRAMTPKAADARQASMYVSTELIVEWLCDQITAQLQVDPRADAMMLARVQEVAMTAQKALMTASAYEVSLPFLAADSKGPKHFRASLTKAAVFGRITGSPG